MSFRALVYIITNHNKLKPVTQGLNGYYICVCIIGNSEMATDAMTKERDL